MPGLTTAGSRRRGGCLAFVFGLVVAGVAAGRAPAGEIEMATPDPAPPLSPFQWALYSDGALMLVPVDGHYYPAERAGSGVIETDPLRIEVAFHGKVPEHEAKTAVALRRVISPTAVGPDSWIMETRDDDGSWSPVETFQFHDMQFYALTTPGEFAHVHRENVRFRRR